MENINISKDSTGFVLLNEYIPNIILDIRYYSNYNFVGKRIDGYLEPCALITKEAAIKLQKVSKELEEKGYLLKIYDVYRPVKAVKHFIKWSKDSDIKMKSYFYPDINKEDLFKKNYISDKSSHSRGSTIDLTLFDIKQNKDVDMGSTFDYFGDISNSNYTNINKEQYNNRMLLKNIMIKNGFIPLKEEWWHFTLKDEPFKDTYFDFDVSSKSINATIK